MFFNQSNLRFIALLIVSSLIFFVIYFIFLRGKYHRKRNLVLNGSYLKSLFDETDSIYYALLGNNSDILIKDVYFIEENFQIKPFLELIDESFNKQLSYDKVESNCD